MDKQTIVGYIEESPQNTNKAILNQMLDEFAEGSGGAQADWNQNDETAKDYIRNRPFYTTKGMGRVLLVSGELSVKDSSYRIWSADPAYRLEIGKEYIVVYGDREERAIGVEYKGEPGDGVKLSDGTADSSFYCVSIEVEGGYEFYFQALGGENFAIYHEAEMDINVTMSEQYLPQNLVEKIKAVPDYNQQDSTALDYIKNKPFTITKYGGKAFQTSVRQPQYTWVAQSCSQIEGSHITGDMFHDKTDLWITDKDIVALESYGGTIGYKFPHGYYIRIYSDTSLSWELLQELNQLGIKSTGLWLDTYIVEDYYRWPYELHSYKGDQISPDLIPNTIARAPKAVLEDVTDAPTAEQYNALLAILRQAGILAT